jgi:pilus assembly protein FimV
MRSTHLFFQHILSIDTSRGVVMFAKSFGRALAVLMVLPSAAFALGLGDIRLLSPLNAPLDAEIELVDVTPEELQSLKAQIASRDTFTRYGLDYPVFLSSVQVRTNRTSDGREIIKLKSADTITEPFITLLVEVNWARGRLVREYTMLLDPPVYTPGQTPASNAPVAAPAVGAGARDGAIARGSETTPPASDTSSVSPTAPGESATSAPAPARAQPSTVGSAAPSADAGGTHVVKRGETLSAIAASASGNSPNSPQARSWMLAIYQANPPAFEKNMNLLRSGAVLRIPDTADVTAISPSEANGEIRRQYAAWRSTTPSSASPSASEPGHLRLVTPTESGSAGNSGEGAETKALQGRIKELETQLNETKRAVAVRDAELAQLQAKLAGAKNPAPAPTPEPAPAAAPPAATPPPAAATQTPPAATAEQPPAQAEANNAAPPPAEEPAPAAEPSPTPAAADTAPVKKPHVAPVAQAEGGSFFDTLKDYWWAIALLIVAALGFLGMRFWRSRRQSEFDDSLGRLAVAGANSMDRGFAAGDTAPVRPLSAATSDGAFLVEESGTHERPRFPGGAAPVPAAGRHVSTDETISSETAINLDQGDPLAEADFHMAYGLYDQAADLIRIAISREPNRRDLKLKLLEVFFVWGNKEQFLQSARELADTRSQAAPGEWEKIIIMGKQLAPDDPLFSGSGTMSGATAGGVDLDLEGGESRVDFDLLGDPVPGHSGGDVDLDIGSALGDASGDTATVTDRSFGLEDSFTTHKTGTTRQMTQRISQETDVVMPEFGAENEGPTVEQPGLNTPENPTIKQKVAMALKQGHNAENTAELAIDDLGLDLGALDTIDQPGLGASSDAPTLVAGMDERSRKVMEEAQRRANSEDRDPAATAAWRMDDSDLHAVLGNGAANGHDEENGSFDSSSTARLTALSDRDVDFDLGDPDADGGGEADADGIHHHQAHAANGAGLDLDVGTATVPDTAFTATQKLASDDLALPDLEPVTMSEVGTKLDLARAYMDMGDPEGARNILEEVMHEGSVAQKQEAQRLMESLPG